MNIPSLPVDRIIDEKSLDLTDSWRQFFDLLVNQLQTNASNEGIVIPTQSETNVLVIQNNQLQNLSYTTQLGTLVYNSDFNQLMVALLEAGKPVFEPLDTSNVIYPVLPSQGGTGVINPTAHTLPVAEGSANFNFLGPLTNGQLLIGSTGGDPVPANITGSGDVTITNGPGTINISVAASGSTWTIITAVSVNAAPNNGYITNRSATPVQVALPAIFNPGDFVEIMGLGAGGFSIVANTGQTIQFGSIATSVSGSISSDIQYCNITIRGLVANTLWSVVITNSNPTVV